MVICGFVLILLKRRQKIAIVESLSTYVLTKTLWLLSMAYGYFLVRTLGGNSILIEGIAVCSLQIGLTSIGIRFVRREWWEKATTKYWVLVVAASSILFIVSYSVVLIPYTKQKREIHIYAFFVALIATIILLIWIFNDFNYRKELEEKVNHINDLVRSAHKYKEIIPGVSYELRRIKDLVEDNSEVSAEVGVAIREVDALQQTTREYNLEELKEAPNLDKTGLLFLDGQLQREWGEACEAGVTFECVVMTPAAELVAVDGVQLFHLMQLVGDLFRNGFRAVQRREGGEGRMLLVLGRSGQSYEVKMCDNGVPFPREVLERLGERGLTTGGTGHGMADTLELLARYRASLEIREEPEGRRFTKVVRISFDGRARVEVDWTSLGIRYERELKEPVKA